MWRMDSWTWWGGEGEGGIIGRLVLTQEAKLQYSAGASLVAQMIKNLPAMQETWVLSLDWEDPLAKGMPTHSSILAQKIPWTEEPGGLQSMGLHRVGHN